MRSGSVPSPKSPGRVPLPPSLHRPKGEQGRGRARWRSRRGLRAGGILDYYKFFFYFDYVKNDGTYARGLKSGICTQRILIPSPDFKLSVNTLTPIGKQRHTKSKVNATELTSGKPSHGRNTINMRLARLAHADAHSLRQVRFLWRR